MSIHNIIQQKRHKRNFMSGVGISNPKKYTLPNEYEEIKYITTRLCDDLNWTQDWNAPFRPGYSTIHRVNNGYIHGLNTNFYPNNNTKIEIWGRLGRPYNHDTYDYRHQMLFGAVGDSGDWSDNNSFDYYLTRGASLNSPNNNSMPYYRWGSTKAAEATSLATVGWYTNGRGRAYGMYVKGTTSDSESNPDPTNVYAGYFKLVCDKNVWTYTLWGRAIDWEDATEEDYADLFSDNATQGTHYCIYKASKTITANTFQCKSPLYLLHTPRDLTSISPKTPTTFRVPAIDLYGCKIWDDGNLVRDYVPVRNKLGTAGLFDKITNTFITDPNIKGSGKAIKPGQSKVISLESIEFTGTQAICIDDYIPNIYTNIELQLKFNSNITASKTRIFWAYAEGVGSNTSKPCYGLYIMTGLKFAFLFRGQGRGSTSTERRGWSQAAPDAYANTNSLYTIKYNTAWRVGHKIGSADSPASHYIESIDFNTGIHCDHPHILSSGYTFITGIDDPTSEYYNPDFSAATPLYIGVNSTSTNYRPYMHLYYFKIYEHSRTDNATAIDLNSSSDNKTLIHDLIPLEIDGEPGLYDKITHKFYTSYVPNTSYSKVLSNYYESYIECVYVDRDNILEDPKPLIFKKSNAYINKDMSFIEYIENIDMSYIDTGYVPSGNDIVIKSKFMPKGYSGGYGAWFGSDVVNNISRYGIIGGNGVYTKILAACGKNENLIIDVPQVNIISNWQDYEIDMSFNQFNYRINNGSWTSEDMPSGNLKGTPTATFKIFRASGHVAYGRLYYLQLYKGSTLLYDLVPVSINGKGYLYNKVNGNILGDDTNNFVLGPITNDLYLSNVSILDSTNSGLIDYVEVINEKRLRGNRNELTALMSPSDTWLYQYSLSCTEYKTRTKTYIDRYIWVDDILDENEEYDIYSDINQFNKYHYVGTMEFENNTYYAWDNEAYNIPNEHLIILTSILDYTGRTLEDDINNRSGFDFMLMHDNSIKYIGKENPNLYDTIVIAYRQYEYKYILPQFNYSGISESSNIVRFYLKNRFVIDRYTFENFHRISLLEFVPYYKQNYWANMYWINSNTPYLKCIADGAFKNASNMGPANAAVGHMHFPSTLTSISSEAFSNVLALNAIDFTDKNVITIGSKAFAYSSGATTEGRAIGLTSVTLSPTITSIASDAFTGCDMISKINIYNQQQIDVFQNAFIDSINRPKNKLLNNQTTGSLNKLTITSSSATEGISIPNSFLNQDVYDEINLSYLSLCTNNNSYFTIGEYAFWGCGLKTVQLDVSNNNAYIGEGAFGNNTLLSTIEIYTKNNNGDTCNPPTYWTYNTTTYTYTYHKNIFADTKLAISGQGQAYVYFMGDPTINPIKPIADQWKNFLTYNKIHTNNIHLEIDDDGFIPL